MSPGTDGKLGQAVPRTKGCPLLTSSIPKLFPPQLGSAMGRDGRSSKTPPGGHSLCQGRARVSFARGSPASHFFFQGLGALGPSPGASLRSWRGEGQQGAQAAERFFLRASSQCSQFGGAPGLLHPSAAPSSSTLGFCAHHGTLKSPLRRWSREGWLGARVATGVDSGVATGVAISASGDTTDTNCPEPQPWGSDRAGTGLGDSTEGTELGRGTQAHLGMGGEHR